MHMYKQLNGKTRHKQEEKNRNSSTYDEEHMKTNHEHSGHSTAPEDYSVVLKYAYLHI